MKQSVSNITNFVFQLTAMDTSMSSEESAVISSSMFASEIISLDASAAADSTLLSASSATNISNDSPKDSPVYKCSKCKCKKSYEAFENEFGKQLKTCKSCRNPKSKQKETTNPISAEELNISTDNCNELNISI